jgi:predicted GNAT family N-acyltransferase
MATSNASTLAGRLGSVNEGKIARRMVRLAEKQEDFFRLIRLREAVFVMEQGVPLEVELDEADDRAIHFVAISGREVVGTALIDFIKKHSKKKGSVELYLHAQESAIPFYERLGFVVEGDRFYEAGIPHRKMALNIKGRATK